MNILFFYLYELLIFKTLLRGKPGNVLHFPIILQDKITFFFEILFPFIFLQ